MSPIKRSALSVLLCASMAIGAAAVFSPAALADDEVLSTESAAPQIGEPLSLPDSQEPAPQQQSGAAEDTAGTSRAVAMPGCAQDILSRVNKERQKAGAEPLQLAQGLNRTAQFWAEWMAATDEFIHLPARFPDEGWAFLTALGASRGLAENIAWGQKTTAEVMDSWMNSAGHRGNILNPGMKYLGVGCASQNAGTYWVQQFAGDMGAAQNGHKRIPIPTDHLKFKVSQVVQVGGPVRGEVVGKLPQGTKVSYQWLLDGVPLPSATSSTYIPGQAQQGHKLSLRVSLSADSFFYNEVVKTLDAGTVKAAVAVEHYFGANRYLTSLEVLRSQWRAGSPLFIVAGAGFPDALAAAPAVAREHGGMLLVPKGGIDDQQLSFLRQNRPGKVYIVGGVNSVSPSVERQLSSIGASPERVQGSDRYATSLKIADKFFDAAPTVFVASGKDYPDALTASAAAAKEESPVVLMSPDSTWLALPYAQLFFDKKTGTLNFVGGAASVSSQLEDFIGTHYGAYFGVQRYAGTDRYSTSAALNDRFFDRTGRAWIASGENFPDALSASWAAGVSDEPLYLARRSCVPGPVSQSLAKHQVVSRIMVGGPTVLGEASATC